MPVISVATTARPPTMESADGHLDVKELHVPMRPSFGRLESTRLAPALDVLDLALERNFAARLQKVFKEAGVTTVHALTHSSDFWPALRLAEGEDMPYFLSVHDDLQYALRGHWGGRISLSRLAVAWQRAEHCYVISEEMGEEYSRRYGRRDYSVVTDGVSEVLDRSPRPEASFRVYFAGLFHLSYAPNADALLKALARLRRARPDAEVTFTCRCGAQQFTAPPEVRVEVLPFSSGHAVREDMQSADYVYMALPFDPRFADFVSYSMSAKLVSYLGSGLPIIYHGPESAAAGRLLSRHGAAIVLPSLDPAECAGILAGADKCVDEVLAGARQLAQTHFDLREHQARFWGPIRRAGMACRTDSPDEPFAGA